MLARFCLLSWFRQLANEMLKCKGLVRVFIPSYPSFTRVSRSSRLTIHNHLHFRYEWRSESKPPRATLPSVQSVKSGLNPLHRRAQQPSRKGKMARMLQARTMAIPFSHNTDCALDESAEDFNVLMASLTSADTAPLLGHLLDTQPAATRRSRGRVGPVCLRAWPRKEASSRCSSTPCVACSDPSRPCI